MSTPVAPSSVVPAGALRLLNIASSIDPAAGDVSAEIVGLSRALAGLGHQVDTLTVDDPKSPWASTLALPAQLKGPPHGRLQYSWEFHRWLHEQAGQYDALLTHGLWRYNSRATRRAAKAAGRPYFVIPHGTLSPWFKRRYWGQHLRKCGAWLLAEEAVLQDAAAVLFAGEIERDLARGSFRPYRCVERVAPIGSDAPPGKADEQRRAFSEKFPELARKRVLLFLGRLHEDKGCDLLLRAFLVQLQALPKDARFDLHVMMAGDAASPGYRDALQSLAAKCDEISLGSVSFPGPLSGDLKWGALRTAEAFVLPSHQEDSSTAAAEALACGTPVLASNAVNVAREIEESGAGLAEPDTLAGCSRLLERWLALTPVERSAMATRATGCFQQKFEITQSARRLVEIIREFIPNQAPAA